MRNGKRRAAAAGHAGTLQLERPQLIDMQLAKLSGMIARCDEAAARGGDAPGGSAPFGSGFVATGHCRSGVQASTFLSAMVAHGAAFFCDRPDHLALPRHRETGRWRDGCCLQGLGLSSPPFLSLSNSRRKKWRAMHQPLLVLNGWKGNESAASPAPIALPGTRIKPRPQCGDGA